MQIVIDIPKRMYEKICDNTLGIEIFDAIRNGTPLPKGHGDLIDVDCLREDFKTSKKISFAQRMDISCIVDHAPIIIEAESEE